MNIKTILLILSLSVFIIKADAQSLKQPDPPKKEFVLMKDGKSMLGSVQYDSINGIIYFKETSKYFSSGDGNKFTILNSDSVVEFRNEKIKYVRKNWKGREQFVVELVSGEISLYNIYDDYFVEKEGRLIELTKDNFSAALTRIYGDRCEWGFNSNNLVYSQQFMIHLVEGYNKKDCFQVYRKQIGLRLNYLDVNNNLFIRTEQVDLDLKKSGIGFGVQIEIPTYNGPFLFVALDFMSQKADGEFDFLNLSDTEVSTTQLILQIGPKFYFGNFFIEAGPTLSLATGEAFVLNNAVNELPIDVSGVGFSLHYGLGYRFMNKEKYSLSLEGRRITAGATHLTSDILSIGVVWGFN